MDSPLANRIQQEVNTSDVVLFMKGSPAFPQCGFSATVSRVMQYLNVPMHTVDVLQDPGIRDGIKEFSNWPTIPQLYVKGEFIGGCDIVREMFETGELQEYLQTQGVEVQPSAEA